MPLVKLGPIWVKKHSILNRLRKALRLKRQSELDVNKHSGYAEDLRQARFIEVYPSFMLYLNALAELDGQFPDLYVMSDHDEEDIRPEENSFSNTFGWVFNCIKVAEVRGISMEAWEMTALETLNIFRYLKAKAQNDLKLAEKSLGQQVESNGRILRICRRIFISNDR